MHAPSLTHVLAVAALAAGGGLAAYHLHAPPWEAWADARAEHDRLAEYHQFNDERMAFNRRLTDDLVAGRVGLGEAVDRFIRANAGRVGFLDVMRMHDTAPTLEECVARHLLLRVREALRDDPAADPGAAARLADEYAARFGRYPGG